MNKEAAVLIPRELLIDIHNLLDTNISICRLEQGQLSKLWARLVTAMVNAPDAVIPISKAHDCSTCNACEYTEYGSLYFCNATTRTDDKLCDMGDFQKLEGAAPDWCPQICKEVKDA